VLISKAASHHRGGRLDRAVLVPERKFAMDSPLEGEGFEPSVPRDRDDGFRSHYAAPTLGPPSLTGALGRARRDPRRHREAQNARSFAATSSASDLRGTPGAPSWTKLELEIGFGDFEHLAAAPFAFSATFEICRDDRIVGRANALCSGSLVRIAAAPMLIAQRSSQYPRCQP
jgi:hypothetical protein